MFLFLLTIIPNICDCLGRGTANELGWVGLRPPLWGGLGGDTVGLCVWVGLCWVGLAWLGLAWLGLAWLGLGWRLGWFVFNEFSWVG